MPPWSCTLCFMSYHGTHFTSQQGSCQEAIYIILIAKSFKYFLFLLASKCKSLNTSTNAKRRAFSVIFICWWAWFSLRPNASHFSFSGKPASKTNLSSDHQNNITKKCLTTVLYASCFKHRDKSKLEQQEHSSPAGDTPQIKKII